MTYSDEYFVKLLKVWFDAVLLLRDAGLRHLDWEHAKHVAAVVTRDKPAGSVALLREALVSASRARTYSDPEVYPEPVGLRELLDEFERLAPLAEAELRFGLTRREAS